MAEGRPIRIGANEVRLAGDCSRRFLESVSELDWTVQAGSLDWDCRATASHIADALAFYAAHLGARSSHWLKFDVVPHADATTGELARLIDAMSTLLAHVIEATPDGVLAFHHSGMWDKSGFAAMACLETLVHTGDVSAGLGIEFHPPQDLCRRIIERLFLGDVSSEEDAWRLLWWGTGRGDLSGRKRLGADWELNWQRDRGG